MRVEISRRAVEQVKAAGRSKPRVGRDPVNQPMINHWTDAIGDRNPIRPPNKTGRPWAGCSPPASPARAGCGTARRVTS